MARIEPGQHERPPSTKGTPLAESEKARQEEGEGRELPTLEGKQRASIWTHPVFSKRAAKKAAIEEVQISVLKQAGISDLDPTHVKDNLKRFITPYLFKKTLNELAAFKVFIEVVGVRDLLASPSLKDLRRMIDLSIQFVEEHPDVVQHLSTQSLSSPLINHLLTTFSTVVRMMDERWTLVDKIKYVQEIASTSDAIPAFEAYIREAARIQSARPKVFMATDQPRLVELWSALKIPFHQLSLDSVVMEILDSTVIPNTQIIHENIGAFFLPLSAANRSIPILKTRYGYEICLSNEFHPDLILLTDGDEEIDFQASTDLYVTNEKTMETRVLRFPLPFSGRMTKTEARKQLTLLEKAIKSPKDFEKNYKKLGLDPKLEAKTKTRFFQWTEKAEIGLGRLLLDFNATPKRPKFSFARELPETKAALKAPSSLKKAIAAAATKNLYLFGKTLSLLPPEIALDHPSTAFLSVDELKTIVQLKPTKIDLPGGTGEVKFTYKQITIGDNEAIELKTTISRNSQTHTRSTLYSFEKGEAFDKPLLHRDVLLAKAEFMGIYGEET